MPRPAGDGSAFWSGYGKKLTRLLAEGWTDPGGQAGAWTVGWRYLIDPTITHHSPSPSSKENESAPHHGFNPPFSTQSAQQRRQLLDPSPRIPLRNVRLADQTHSTLVISYAFKPPGIRTSTTSPLSLPIIARAMGEVIEMRPSFTSASCSPTIW